MAIPAARGVGASGIPPAGDQANAVLAGQITAIGPTAPFAFRGPMNLALYASINTALTTTAGSLSATVASGASLAVGDAINSVNVPPGATIDTLAVDAITLALMPYAGMGKFNMVNGQLTGFFDTARLLGSTITIPQSAVEGVTLPANTTVSAIVKAFVAPTDTSPGVAGIVQLSANPTAVPPDPNPRAFQAALTANAITVTGADAAALFTGAAIAWTGTVQMERSFDGGSTWIVCNVGGSGQLAQYTAGPISLTFGEPEKQVLYRLNCTAFEDGTINYRISQTGGAAESLAIGPLSGG